MNQSSRGRVVIAGGSGFVGTSMTQHLTAQGWSVVVLSRRTPTHSSARYVTWDARSPGPWMQELDGAAGLINLVGRTVDCIKTPDHCDEILRSRVEATRVLGIAVRSVSQPPPVWIQMSTAHIYGDPPHVTCDEDSAFGYGLAPNVARAWEEAFAASALPEQRRVIFRTSFVIGRDRNAGGGALARLTRVAKLGLGGRVGSGTQGMSWIHEADLNRLFERALTDPSMTGAYIASSPQPVAQQAFMRTLRRVLRIPVGLPAPAWLVRWGAPLVMQTDPELALYGRYVISRRLAEAGYKWQFDQLEPALRDALQRRPA